MRVKEEEYLCFRKGVNKAGNADLLNSLFSVRVNQLFNVLNRTQNYYYLSGLLIGTELRNLYKYKSSNIALCSGSNVFEFYKLAIDELRLSAKTQFISPEYMEKAAIAGQIKLLKSYQQNKVNEKQK
jgi:2-dehydro-3-deoxygalactonokinase